MVENGTFPYILFNFCQAYGYQVLTHFYVYLHFSISEFEYLFTYFFWQFAFVPVQIACLSFAHLKILNYCVFPQEFYFFSGTRKESVIFLCD